MNQYHGQKWVNQKLHCLRITLQNIFINKQYFRNILKKLIKISPFYIPFLDLLCIALKIEIKIFFIIESFLFLMTVFKIIKQKKIYSFIIPVIVFITFLILHSVYSAIFTPHIFNTIITVNLQISILLMVLIYYSFYPLSNEEIHQAFKLLNIFGIVISFFLFLNYFGIPFIETIDTEYANENRFFGFLK